MARILVLSGDHATALALCTVLEQAGHEVFKATDYEKATTTFRQSPPDLVLCDISMPLAVNTIDELERQHVHTKTIILGKAGCAIPQRLRSLKTLTTPLHTSLLLSAIDELVVPTSCGRIDYSASPEMTTVEPQTHRSPRALVIEDDATQRELLATAAREAGFEVVEVADGDEALTYLYNQGKADVILLDMALPRLHGPTVIRVLRSDPIYSGTPILGVSGHSFEHFQVEMGAAGLNRWFQKPIDWDELASVLANLAKGNHC